MQQGTLGSGQTALRLRGQYRWFKKNLQKFQVFQANLVKLELVFLTVTQFYRGFAATPRVGKRGRDSSFATTGDEIGFRFTFKNP